MQNRSRLSHVLRIGAALAAIWISANVLVVGFGLGMTADLMKGHAEEPVIELEKMAALLSLAVFVFMHLASGFVWTHAFGALSRWRAFLAYAAVVLLSVTSAALAAYCTAFYAPSLLEKNTEQIIETSLIKAAAFINDTRKRD